MPPWIGGGDGSATQHRQGEWELQAGAKGFALDRHIPSMPHACICTRCTFPACPFGSRADTAASSCHCALRRCRVPRPQLPSIPASPGPQPGCTQETLPMSLSAQSCPQRRGSCRNPVCIPFPMRSATLQEAPGRKDSQRRRKRTGQTYGMCPRKRTACPSPAYLVHAHAGINPIGQVSAFGFASRVHAEPSCPVSTGGTRGHRARARSSVPVQGPWEAAEAAGNGIPHRICPSHIPGTEGPEGAQPGTRG